MMDKMNDKPKLGIIFAINNYAIIVSAMKTINMTENESEEFKYFKQKLDECIQQYIQMELNEHLKKWVNFINNTDHKLQQNSQTKVDLSLVESITIDFKQTWQNKAQNGWLCAFCLFVCLFVGCILEAMFDFAFIFYRNPTYTQKKSKNKNKNKLIK